MMLAPPGAQITAKKEALQTEKKMAADMELQHIEAARKEYVCLQRSFL